MNNREKIASGIFEAKYGTGVNWDEWKDYVSKHRSLQSGLDEIYRFADIVLKKLEM